MYWLAFWAWGIYPSEKRWEVYSGLNTCFGETAKVVEVIKLLSLQCRWPWWKSQQQQNHFSYNSSFEDNQRLRERSFILKCLFVKITITTTTYRAKNSKTHHEPGTAIIIRKSSAPSCFANLSGMHSSVSTQHMRNMVFDGAWD